MKKFYEKPVVEITVFDEECIMTASGVTRITVDGNNAGEIETALNAMQNTMNIQAINSNGSAYNW